MLRLGRELMRRKQIYRKFICSKYSIRGMEEDYAFF